jgi:hypothetical protein
MPSLILWRWMKQRVNTAEGFRSVNGLDSWPYDKKAGKLYEVPLELPLIKTEHGLLDSGSTSLDVAEPIKSYTSEIVGWALDLWSSPTTARSSSA